MGLRRTLALTLVSVCVACAPQQQPPPPALASVVIAAPTAAERAMTPSATLPAYLSAAETLSSVKTDAADDYRAANPQWFAQTVPPPTGEFRPYGEWETMQAVWTTYSNGMPNSPAVRRMFAEQTISFVRYSKPQVKAYVIVNNNNVANDFNKALDTYGIKASEKSQVQTVILPNQTIWLMDYSGFPLVNKATGQVSFADWIYYQPRQLDDALGTRVGTDFYKGTVFRTPFPFEGGNIQADGTGQCATTTRALSNTGFSAAKVRNVLKKWAACKTTYILKDITDDGTGHLDMFFKWLAPNHVLISEYEDSLTLDYNGDNKNETLPMPGKVAADYQKTWQQNKQRMEDNVKLFQGAKTSAGGSFKISRLTMMTRFKDKYGNLPRTFINSTFTNGANVYPSYTTKSCRNAAGKVCVQDSQCPNGTHCAAGRCTNGPTTVGCDEIVKCSQGLQCVTDPFKVALTARAQKQWEAVLPSYKHVGLRADTIAGWSGAIHCITRTIPKGPVTKTVGDGYCVKGTCGCVAGGANFACSDNKQCVGAARVCGCALCKGKCKSSGKSCTDDADCSNPIVSGSCVIDSAQTCPGQSGGGGGGGNTSDPCNGVSYEGKCEGKKLLYCENGLKSQNCGSCCGWESGSGFYNCLSGAACQGCVNECSSSGQKGCSSKQTHAWTCEKVGGCFVRKWNKCAQGCSQGACKGGSTPANQVDKCPDGPSPDAGADAGSPDTGTTDTGKTDTGKADTGKTDTGTADTGTTDTGAPPKDTGSTCQPNCAGKACGPDGCGNICGVCPGNTTCVAGQCESRGPEAGGTDSTCVPQCGVCGPDGCGGSCGKCKSGFVCVSGACMSEAAAADAGSSTPRADGTASAADGLTSPDAGGGGPVKLVNTGQSSGCSAGRHRSPSMPWLLTLMLTFGLVTWRQRCASR